MPRQRKLAPEQENELVTDYRAGVTWTELTEKYGLSREGVRGILARHGVTANRQSHEGIPTDDAELHRLAIRSLVNEFEANKRRIIELETQVEDRDAEIERLKATIRKLKNGRP